jgi:dihydrofolate reductase
VKEPAMRKVILMMQVSLDGFIEGPGQDLSWHRVDEELHSHFNDLLRTMGGFLDGRVTYEMMAEYWPTADQDPSSSASEIEFAGIWRDMPKIVYSRTLAEAGWNTEVAADVVVEDVVKLKEQPGGDLALGGANLSATFRSLGLIDEYWIYVHPVLIGRGTPLFKETDALTPLRLLESRTFGSGVVLLRYAAEPDSAHTTDSAHAKDR